jgi:hypothetical protein
MFSFPSLLLICHCNHTHTQIRTKLKLFLFGLSVCRSVSLSLCLSLNLSLYLWFESHIQISSLFFLRKDFKKELINCPFVCQSCHVENFENFSPFCSRKRDRDRELFLVPENRWREVFRNCFHENFRNCREMTGKL